MAIIHMHIHQTWKKLHSVQAALVDIYRNSVYFEDIFSQISRTFDF